MMTGGKNAYGPGGYFRSQLEPIMPVSMELRQEHRKLALAIVVTMDRSGSMAAQASGGRTKMDLANIAAVQVLDLLSPMDELGVIAVDSSSHTIVDLAPVNDTAGHSKRTFCASIRREAVSSSTKRWRRRHRCSSMRRPEHATSSSLPTPPIQRSRASTRS